MQTLRRRTKKGMGWDGKGWDGDGDGDGGWRGQRMAVEGEVEEELKLVTRWKTAASAETRQGRQDQGQFHLRHFFRSFFLSLSRCHRLDLASWGMPSCLGLVYHAYHQEILFPLSSFFTRPNIYSYLHLAHLGLISRASLLSRCGHAYSIISSFSFPQLAASQLDCVSTFSMAYCTKNILLLPVAALQ